MRFWYSSSASETDEEAYFQKNLIEFKPNKIVWFKKQNDLQFFLIFIYYLIAVKIRQACPN